MYALSLLEGATRDPGHRVLNGERELVAAGKITVGSTLG